MVHFGAYLTSFRNPAWAEYYINYEQLKKDLYALETAYANIPETERANVKQSSLPEGHAFEQQLTSDLKKISEFYEKKLAALEVIFQTLKNKVESEDTKKLAEADREKIKDEFHALYVELHLLRDFSSLNYTGFSKILKKHDKTLPQFKMKREYFKHEIDALPVFGILTSLYRLQAQTQQTYSEYFSGFNRLDTEISFGAALAKATAEIQQESGGLRQKLTSRAAQFVGQSTLAMDAMSDHLLMSEYMQSYRQQKEPTDLASNALWQRARVAIMAVQSLSKKSDVTPIIISLLLIFLGGCGQAFCLEYMVSKDRGSGSTITFFQFLFVSLEGLKDYLTWDSSNTNLLKKISSMRLKPLKIPIKYHIGCVLLSWLAAILSSWAYSYNISVPFQMVFKSSILLVNMAIGSIVLGKRYSFEQVASVVLLTFGIMLSTYASLPNAPQKDDAESISNFWTWMFGLAILASSLLFTGFLGILQDLAFRNYGQHWKEALFYAHFLGIPLFFSIAPEVWHHLYRWTVGQPFMWVVLILNTIASFMGVLGIYNLTGLTSSLTSNLTMTVRKFLSLILSVVYFQNDFTLFHWAGAILVLLGTVLYTGASQAKPKVSDSKKRA